MREATGGRAPSASLRLHSPVCGKTSNPACRLCASLSVHSFLPPALPHRAERAKAKSLKDKFRGASRDDMAAGAGWGAAPSSGWAGAGGAGGSPGLSHQGSLAHGDEGHLGEQGQALGGEARPGKVRWRRDGLACCGPCTAAHPRSACKRGRKACQAADALPCKKLKTKLNLSTVTRARRCTQGYGTLPTSAASDAVAATAQRIQGLRQAGLLQEGPGPSDGPAVSSTAGGARPLARPSSETCLAAVAGGSSAGGMAGSRSYDDLSGAASADGTHVRPGGRMPPTAPACSHARMPGCTAASAAFLLMRAPSLSTSTMSASNPAACDPHCPAAHGQALPARADGAPRPEEAGRGTDRPTEAVHQRHSTKAAQRRAPPWQQHDAKAVGPLLSPQPGHRLPALWICPSFYNGQLAFVLLVSAPLPASICFCECRCASTRPSHPPWRPWAVPSSRLPLAPASPQPQWRYRRRRRLQPLAQHMQALAPGLEGLPAWPPCLAGRRRQQSRQRPARLARRSGRLPALRRRRSVPLLRPLLGVRTSAWRGAPTVVPASSYPRHHVQTPLTRPRRALQLQGTMLSRVGRCLLPRPHRPAPQPSWAALVPPWSASRPARALAARPLCRPTCLPSPRRRPTPPLALGAPTWQAGELLSRWASPRLGRPRPSGRTPSPTSRHSSRAAWLAGRQAGTPVGSAPAVRVP